MQAKVSETSPPPADLSHSFRPENPALAAQAQPLLGAEARTFKEPVPSAGIARQVLSQAAQGIPEAVKILAREFDNYSTSSDTRAKPLARLRELFPTQVISPESWNALEVDKFLLQSFELRDETQLRYSDQAAFAALYRSCAQLPTDPTVIRLRQDAARELASNSPVAQEFKQLIADFSLSRYLQVVAMPPMAGQYTWYRENAELSKSIFNRAQAMPEPQSMLLREARQSILAFAESELGKHYRFGSSFTFAGLESSDKPSVWAHAFRFWPYAIDPIFGPLGYGTMAASALTAAFVAGEGAASTALNCLTFAGMVGLSTYLYHFGRNLSNREQVSRPLVGMAQRDFTPVLGAAVLISELLALQKAEAEVKQPMAYPKIVEADGVKLQFKGMGSPLHPGLTPTSDLDPESAAKIRNRQACRLNDFDVDGDAFSALLGPNSGGKTYTARALNLNVIRTQLGARAWCSEGMVAPCSKMVWYSPKQNDSESTEGSLGAELAPLGALLKGGIDKRTLLTCDDLGRGAAESAIADKAFEILDVVRTAGARVVLITHNGVLIRNLQESAIPLKAFHPELLQQADGNSFLSCRILPGYPPAHIKPADYVEAVAQRLGIGSAQLQELKRAILADLSAESLHP
jgi:hypothetical protein